MDIKLKNYYLFSVPVNFEISKIHIPYSRHVIVEVLADGKLGTGEGVSYRSKLSEIEKYICDGVYDLEPGLAAAVDQAALDAAGLIPHDLRHDYTKQVFIEAPDVMFVKIEKLVKGGCRQIKLKLGRNSKNDIYLINELRKRYAKIEFKADVNGGYELNEFKQVIDQTENFIKIWEEPVAKKNLTFLGKFKKGYGIKVMLDENVKTVCDLEFYIKNKVIDILNIKLPRIGGVTAAKKYVEICQRNNILISIGCSEELGVGMQATSYLASQITNLFGIEGVGAERLGFDVVDAGVFSFKMLKNAAQQFNFRIFTKENKMNVLDKISEYKENINAKYNNLLIRLCR